jgi:predicted P-loop ATPase/ribosomal protein L37AE/L43A
MNLQNNGGRAPISNDRPRLERESIHNQVKSNTVDGFDIRKHIEKLEPAKEKGKYICPSCGDKNLSIGLETGAYKCWSTGCKSEDIRNAIAPLTPQAKTEYRQQKAKPKSAKQKAKDSTLATVHIESKVRELLFDIEEGRETPATAKVHLSNWCKEEEYDKFSASQLLQEGLKKASSGSTDEKPRLLKEHDLIRSKFGDRLRYNTLLNQVEMDGEHFDPPTAKIQFVIHHQLNLKSGREDIADITAMLAKERSYSPVVEYLDRVHQEHGGDTSVLDGIAERYFGASEPIHQIVLRRFLIAAVARAYEPGCQCDTALILQGKQGYGKSSFFRVLASPQWFDDSLGQASDKDERLKLHRAWFIEWAELETVFKRKDIAQVKAFMTTKIEIVRAPYGRSLESLKRSSVFVGTTNEHEFLADSTGNRRFWVIPTSKPLDTRALQRERDLIWAAAVTLYSRDEPWYLNEQDEALMEEKREEYRTFDPWHHLIASYVECLPEVTIDHLLENVIHLEVARRSKREGNRVGAILRGLGWKTAQPRRNGKKLRLWIKE